MVETELPAWYPAVEDNAVPSSAWRSLWRYSLESGELSRLSPEGVNCWEAGWCGTDRLVAVTSSVPDEDAWYHAVLTLIDVSSGQSRELLRSPVQFGWPAGSPDGRYAAIVQAVCSDRGLVAGDITVVDLSSDRRTTVDTEGTDVTWLQWIDAHRLGYLGIRHPLVPLLVSRGCAVLSPNPRGSSGRGQGFAGRVVGDMSGADTYDYLSGIDALIERDVVAPTRVGLTGISYGGFMSSWLVTQDRRFAAAVPAKDRCTPAGQAREFHQALRANGVETVLAVYPQEGHGIRSYPAIIDFLTRAVTWFDNHMPVGLQNSGLGL